MVNKTSLKYDHGSRVREFFNLKAQTLLSSYKNIEKLIPHATHRGAAHTGEDGRYSESLVRRFLNDHLPKDLKALTGFIYKPATKTGKVDKSRYDEKDEHSSQLDIIIYDVANYPIFESAEEFVIVPPEGVLAVISVKKALRLSKLDHEIECLTEVAKLCQSSSKINGKIVRGPSLSVFSFATDFQKTKNPEEQIYKRIVKQCERKMFDHCINSVIGINWGSVFKRRPECEEVKNAEYVFLKHDKEDLFHQGLQILMTGIFSAYYDETKNNITRPGFTSFQRNKPHDKNLGNFQVKGLR